MGSMNEVGRTRCAVVGDQSLAAECAEIAIEHGLDIVVIATNHPVVSSFAQTNGIPHVDSTAGLAHALRPYDFDVLFSIANLRILPDAVLEQAGTRINFHDGPLPGYAGINVTSWAILGGEQTHGIAWHLMTPQVDAGEIVTTETFEIRPDETAFELNAACYEAAVASFPRIAVALADGTFATTPQPAGRAQLFRKHERPCVVFDPTDAAAITDRAIRAHAIGDRVRNTFGSVRLVVDRDIYVVQDVDVIEPTDAAVGTVVALDGSSARVRAADADLVINSMMRADGTPVRPADVLSATSGADARQFVAAPEPAVVAALRELDPHLSRYEEAWLDRLGSIEIPSLPATSADGTAEWATREIGVPSGAGDAQVVAALATWIACTTGAPDAVFAYTDPSVREVVGRLGAFVQLPVAQIDTTGHTDVRSLTAAAAVEMAWIGKHGTFLSDAVGRDPRTHGRDFGAPVMIGVDLDDVDPAPTLAREATSLCFAVGSGGGRLAMHHRLDRIDPSTADRVAGQVTALLGAIVADPARPLSSLEMLGDAEISVLDAFNDTALDHERVTTVDLQFRDQLARTPDAPAISSGSRTLSYSELGEAVTELARRLRAGGVGQRDRVGVAVHRGIDMVVSVLATLECGAAYVPLDPTYPEDRLRFMVTDSGLVALLAQGEIAGLLAREGVTVIDPAGSSGSSDAHAEADATVAHGPADLAYVIYTSGSTGTPKGVMLEHRNVVNFFAAMDEVIEHDHPGVWLAVTSLSFDISVLELLWTLTRGFHVVLKSESGLRGAPDAVARGATARRPVSLSMFYFAAGDDRASDGYRLLLESARFADRNGFEAVWTPERHFHAFGGSYPNPSVVGAAIAAITERIHVRAGSVVLPLHSPVRVAEEWAIVDNLTGGRTGISFAAGWQPNDFVLNPTAYATAREALPSMIDTVARLWRGESVSLPGHDGEPVEVRTLPRPVQAELPIWLTSAGSTSTFERAGTLGTNVLTHLLGQSVEQLASNIEAYRRAWRDAGHDGEGRVTLMLHTFLDRDAAVSKQMAREPMKSYLGTAVGLLKDMASAFPTFANSGKGADEAFKSLTPDEMSQLLDMAAARYLETSGLFGTPDDAVELIERTSAIGVDEVACLIDFGVDTDAVLDSLELLREAKDIVDAARADTAPGDDVRDDRPDASMAELVTRHSVTHLQCTPSLAAMLLADPRDRAALASIRHMMVGGEALPTALAGELRRILPDRFTNMYGPTETTIWSLVHEISDVPDGSIPIGLPIGNNTVFVLDQVGRRVPVGVFGELHIGGEGVARGYHGRDELTAARFFDRPGLGRVYATGDVVRIHPDHFVEFAGRADNQVKIRGHRIELGEIETVLDSHPDVVQSVVVARGDVTDPRLVAFVILHGGMTTDPDGLRKHVADTLPDVMVPAAVVVLDAFPLTPNGKIDRKAFPDGPIGITVLEPTAPPAGDAEEMVARIWTEELARPVGRDDNFFEIGGHSLLAVKVFRRLSNETDVTLALTDIFRYPTIRAFAAHLAAAQDGSPDVGGNDAVAAPTGTSRGALRRRARSRQGGLGDG